MNMREYNIDQFGAHSEHMRQNKTRQTERNEEKKLVVCYTISIQNAQYVYMSAFNY